MTSVATAPSPKLEPVVAKAQAWLDTWGPDLWQIAAASTREPSALTEDFVDAMLSFRRRHSQKFLRLSSEALSRLFLKTWILSQRAKGSLGVRSPLDSSAEDRALLAALFQANWPAAKAEEIFAFSASKLRFRALRALRYSGNAPALRSPAVSRDCHRAELVIIDRVLSTAWKDPMGFFGPEALDRHLQNCARCSALAASVDGRIEELRAVTYPSFEPAFAELRQAYAEVGGLGGWFSTLPLGARLPIMGGVSAVVVFTVIAIPYLGDFFPVIGRWADDIGESTSTFAKETAERFKSAPEAPVVAKAEPELISSASTVVVSSAVAEVAAAKPMPVATPAAVSKPAVVAVVTPPPPAPVPPPAPPKPVKVAVVAEEPKAKVPEGTPKADPSLKSFYQWTGEALDIETAVTALQKLLTETQAERAGDLTLGARYRGGRYFHFTIPEDSYETFRLEVEALGISNLAIARARGIKDRPVGRARIVFLVKEKR